MARDLTCPSSFREQVRRTSPDDNFNHDIHTIVRIPCPDELIGITQLQRGDDLNGETGQPIFEELFGPEVYSRAQLLLEDPDARQYLSSTMDCCASAATDPRNTNEGTEILIDFVPDRNVLPVCGDTGY